MKNIDYPPKLSDNAGKENLKDISVESFEDTREVKYSPEDPSVLQKKEELFHDQERIKELGTQLRSERIAEINSIPLRQPLGNEPWSASKNTPTNYSLGRKLRNFTVAALATLGMVGGAKAADKNPGDSTIKPKSEKSYDLSTARKVAQVPNDYKFLKTEGAKSYHLKESDRLEFATQGVKGSPEEYMNTMIKKVQSGISPQELVKKGYVDSEGAAYLQKFFVPSELDIVYTEKVPTVESKKVQEADPFAAYVEMGTIYYGPNAHAAAEVRFATRNSQQIQDGGTRNTQESPVYIQFRDDFKDIGKPFLLPAAEMQKYFAGTDRFVSQDAYDTLFKRAMNEEGIGTISTKDLANK